MENIANALCRAVCRTSSVRTGRFLQTFSVWTAGSMLSKLSRWSRFMPAFRYRSVH
jgi:hypothetical protein